MTPARTFANRNIALFGLGGSGLATARALAEGGASVSVWDDNQSAREKAVAAGFAPVDLSKVDWSAFQSFVLAPGVPLTHPQPHWTVERAKAAGVEIIGDIEIFCRERRALAPNSPFLAITGTNGKSTTTALVAHILREAGYDVQMGGNIGVPVLDLAPPSDARVHVIECSTFQIDLAPSLDPHVGVLLNLTPDHIDRHGTMENYAAIKERLVASASFAVVGVDDDFCRGVCARLQAADRPVQAISQARSREPACCCYDDRKLRRQVALAGEWRVTETLVDLTSAQALRGAHNGQNAAAAFAACDWLGVAHDDIGRGMKSFPGLAHRMEQVARRGRTLFVNDSKATNADAAEKALKTFENIHWIVGGKAKEGGVEPLRPLFSRVTKAYLIGASSDDFARTLDGAIAYERCGTLDIAVAHASADAARSTAPEPVVLLSPACASYDQFPNFERRGDAFRALVQDLVKAGDAS
ncbi:MAG: UDP-N-acetylmuramoyl-L-alanine--D-glutamate ligase [Hyphomicrobiales bacterium]|nr:UDP-N-acetylmuramoyl-L-alanine--D-glutamate ligase [Hyphomicrobiales bacterium]